MKSNSMELIVWYALLITATLLLKISTSKDGNYANFMWKIELKKIQNIDKGIVLSFLII